MSSFAASEREKLEYSISNRYGSPVETDEDGSTGAGGGRRIGGSIRAENLSFTISPTLTITGQTIIIGTMGIEEMKDTMGTAVVETVQEAIDTGSLDMSKVSR